MLSTAVRAFLLLSVWVLCAACAASVRVAVRRELTVWAARFRVLVADRLVGYQVAIDSPVPPSDGWSCVKGAAPAPTIVLL